MKPNSCKIFQKIIIFYVVTFFHLSVNAQLSKNVAYFQKKYPRSNIVNTNNELAINIAIENNEILISQTSTTEDLFLNESATQYSKESVSYSTFFQLEKIEAASYTLQNENYIENKVSEFREKDELNGSFHDDVKSLNFIYPNLSPGSKTKLQLKEKITNPRFLGAFYFGGYYPVLNSKLTITADKNIELDFKSFNLDTLNITFNKVEKRNKTIYSWEVKNVDAIYMEEGTPNYKNYYPHIFPVIKQYQTTENKIVKLSSNVEDLYNWYYSLISNINKAPLNKDLVKQVEELVKNKTTDIEKVRAIYYWVQNNIKYIAFEYALGGFIPREANEVYNKKFGDCKDNSSILQQMLQIAGIKGNLTWIGTREIPYTYNQLPLPAVDNHMILAYTTNNKTYFLDATGRYIPLEMPTSFIQGKEALISDGLNKFEIKKIPIIDAEKNKIENFSVINIEENKIKGKATQSYSGYSKINLFNTIESLNTDKKITEYYSSELQKGNNKFSATNIIETNKFSYDEIFKLDYDFSIPDYIVSAGDELYINLNLDKKIQEFYIESYRKTDIETDFKKSFSYTNELNIPNNYIIEYLPENVILENDFTKVTISYQQTATKIIYKHTINFNFLKLNKENQKEYTDLLKKVEKAYKEIVILKKVKN